MVENLHPFPRKKLKADILLPISRKVKIFKVRFGQDLSKVRVS